MSTRTHIGYYVQAGLICHVLPWGTRPWPISLLRTLESWRSDLHVRSTANDGKSVANGNACRSKQLES